MKLFNIPLNFNNTDKIHNDMVPLIFLADFLNLKEDGGDVMLDVGSLPSFLVQIFQFIWLHA